MPTSLKTHILLHAVNSILCMFSVHFSFFPLQTLFPSDGVAHLLTLQRVIFVIGPATGSGHLLCEFLSFSLPF